MTIGHHLVEPKAINLFVEYFAARNYAERFQSMRSRGVKVGVVATELMMNGTIPYWRHGMAFSSKSDENMMRRRMDSFHAVLPHIDFLWSLLPRTAAEYATRCAVSEHFPVGSTREIDPNETRAPKDIDVFFFGRATPHRHAVIERLVRAGLEVAFAGAESPIGWLPDFMLESLLDRSKIGLNLTLEEGSDGPRDPRFASCMRIKDMLERGACVVSEDIPQDNPYQPFMICAPVDELAERCRALVQTGDWRRAAQSNKKRFRGEMEAREICRPVVERTMGHLS